MRSLDVFLDVLTSLLIRNNPPKIIRAAARRLSARIPQAETNYIRKLEYLVDEHMLIQKVQQALNQLKSKEDLDSRLGFVDKE